MGNCFGSPVNNHSTPVTSSKINSKPNGVTGRNVAVGAKRPAGNISSKRNATTDQSSTSTREFVAPPPEVSAAAPSDTSLPIDEVPKLKEFTLVELKKCTQNFKPATMLGEGGFGRVFKGWVDHETYAPSKVGIGMAVAVKKSNPDSFQGHQQWQAEVNFLGKYRHPNLVRLLGHCCEENQFLLVYEYMQKGSLENHLFRKGQEPLRWETRLQIAIGAARGLAFLHTSDRVIYRDFKSSNILLDPDYNAKLSDFGLAKLGPINGNSHVTTRILGTYGYAAPEYVATGHLYVKSDVYGFGVVLLEMLTGLRALDNNRPTPEQNLVEWLRPSLHKKKELKKMMDPGLGDDYSLRGACLAAELILKCLESDPKSRPSMEEVVVILEKVNAIKEKPKVNAKASVSSHHKSPNHQLPSHGHALTSQHRY